MDFELGVAAYAAIVATGALSLEVRRWFESGFRINLRVQSNMIAMPSKEEFVVVTVRNRGAVATTITNVGILKRKQVFRSFHSKPYEAYIIANPTLDGATNQLPFLLEPGMQWTGFIKRSGTSSSAEKIDFEDGQTFIAISTSYSDRQYTVRIPKSRPAPTPDLHS